MNFEETQFSSKPMAMGRTGMRPELHADRCLTASLWCWQNAVSVLTPAARAVQFQQRPWPFSPFQESVLGGQLPPTSYHSPG